MVKVKICGLSEEGSLATAVQAGADYVGFVFYARSPRYVAPHDAARLARGVPAHVARVGLFVDPDDAAMAAVLNQVPLDYLQLHGAETPQRVAQIRKRFGLPVIKAVAIASGRDAENAKAYEADADMLLFDAKPPPDQQALPGGNGLVFDWTLIAGYRWARPWMLSGGLTPDNLVDALRISGAKILDVSSGVESAPGVKDVEKIRSFVKTAKQVKLEIE